MSDYYSEQSDPEQDLWDQISMLVPYLKEFDPRDVFEAVWEMDDSDEGIGFFGNLPGIKEGVGLYGQFQYPSDIIIEFLRSMVDFSKVDPVTAWLEFGVGEDPYTAEEEEEITKSSDC